MYVPITSGPAIRPPAPSLSPRRTEADRESSGDRDAEGFYGGGGRRRDTSTDSQTDAVPDSETTVATDESATGGRLNVTV